jgi:rare lipoprotein A
MVMRVWTRHRAKLTLVVAVCLVGCGGGEARQEEALQRLQPEELAKQAQLYPRLGEEPLPEPQPSPDAHPEDPPEGLPERVLETVQGDATFYARLFEGRRTASGVPFRQNQMVAAHRAYPFGTILRVTNLRNDASVNVRVVDRGPFGSSAAARRTVIDLSRRAAERLGFLEEGRTQVKVEVLEWGRGVTVG